MQNTFVTIARYQYSAEAQIVKGRLETEGIKVYLSDNITIDTDPLVSNAIGGVKLKVLNTDENKARHILKAIKVYSLDDNGTPIKCPNCNAERIQIFSTITDVKSLVSFIIGFLFSTLPFAARYTYKCDSCGNEFPIK